MAQSELNQILAALNSSGTPVQANPQLPPQSQGYTAYPTHNTPANGPQYSVPQPLASGNVDLSHIRPVNSGSLSMSDSADKDRAYGSARGASYDDGRPGQYIERDVKLRRSRSRSPQRSNRDRDMFRNNYNPYIDERRDDQRHGAVRGFRDRSFSPALNAGLPARPTMSAQSGFKGDVVPYRSPNEHGTDIEMVDSNLVGLIIGRDGENLKRVELETSTRVQFMAAGPDGTSQQRPCKITGTRAAREHAKAEIARMIDENARERAMQDRSQSTSKQAAGQQANLRSGADQDSTQMMVPNRTVGLIIGRHGETIRDLQERSGCHVSIAKEDKSVNGLRPVNLIGSKAAAAVAKELILEIVDSDNKGLGQAGQEVQGPPRHAQSVPMPMENPNQKIDDSITVPSDAVGMIIGKGGDTIKDMQNFTSCKINVSKPSGRDIEREIGLIGTRAAIEHAKHAIMEKVRAVEDKNRNNRQGPSGFDRNPNHQPMYGSANPETNGGYDQRQMAYETQPNDQVVQQGQAADPYAAYGGFENWKAWWAYAQYYQTQDQSQNTGQPGSAPPHS